MMDNMTTSILQATPTLTNRMVQRIGNTLVDLDGIEIALSEVSRRLFGQQENKISDDNTNKAECIAIYVDELEIKTNRIKNMLCGILEDL